MTTPQTTPELLACPFCGGGSHLDNTDHPRADGSRLFWVDCYECGISGKIRETAAQAIAAWNRRATTPGVTAAPLEGGARDGPYDTNPLRIPLFPIERTPAAPESPQPIEPRFQQTYCQTCGGKCGPGDDGPIDCRGHAKKAESPAPAAADDHVPDAGKMVEATEWRKQFWEVARALNCLPSTFADANDHVLREAKRFAALRCLTCNGHGLIGGMTSDGGHGEECPDCFGSGTASPPPPGRMVALTDWQPIETAPKDGFHFLLYAPELQFVGFWATGCDHWCYVAPGCPVAPTQPTHWMPLTKAPEGGIKEGS